MSLSHSNLKNELLRSLSDSDLAALSPSLSLVDLPKAHDMVAANLPMPFVYFIETGIASIVAKSPEGHSLEVGLIGRDGMTCTAAILGSDRSTLSAFMQVAGTAYRMELAPFQAAMAASPSLREHLMHYALVMHSQTAFTALSNSAHQIDERLARWILMCHDRTDGDEILLTHEFLALMLGVRRPSVTTSLHVLEGNRMIISERGKLTVRNRATLEEFAGDSYGIPEAEHRRLIGPFGKGLH